MDTKAIIGKGTKVGYSDTVDGTPTWLAEVTVAGQPEMSIGNVDATHYESPDSTSEKLSAVWRDYADVPVTLNYEKTQTATLYTIAGVTKYLTIQKPDASTYKFRGFISKLGGGDIPNKDVIRQSANVTITSKVTFTAGGSST